MPDQKTEPKRQRQTLHARKGGSVKVSPEKSTEANKDTKAGKPKGKNHGTA